MTHLRMALEPKGLILRMRMQPLGSQMRFLPRLSADIRTISSLQQNMQVYVRLYTTPVRYSSNGCRRLCFLP